MGTFCGPDVHLNSTNLRVWSQFKSASSCRLKDLKDTGTMIHHLLPEQSMMDKNLSNGKAWLLSLLFRCPRLSSKTDPLNFVPLSTGEVAILPGTLLRKCWPLWRVLNTVWRSLLVWLLPLLFFTCSALAITLFRWMICTVVPTAICGKLPSANITTTFVDATVPENVEKAIQENTKLVWIETPTNPTLKVVDIEKVAELVHKRGNILLVV